MRFRKSCDLNVTRTTTVLCTREVMAAASDENTRYVWTDEGTLIFLDLVQETNMNAILDEQQRRRCLFATFNYVITLLCLLLLV